MLRKFDDLDVFLEGIKIYTYWLEKDYLKVETKSFFSFMHNNLFKSFISALHDDEVLDSKNLNKLEEYFKNLNEEDIDD